MECSGLWGVALTIQNPAWCAPLSSSRVTRAVGTRTLPYIRKIQNPKSPKFHPDNGRNGVDIGVVDAPDLSPI
jgi:hypothetical protein